MKLIRTAKIKLDVSPSEILPTLLAYTRAFNFVSQEGFQQKEKNGINLHRSCYLATREYLPSQLAISARMKATEALCSVFSKKKKHYSCPRSTLSSVRYDKNSYTLFLSKNQVSLLTVSGRKRYDLVVPKYYQELFLTWKNTSADLCIKKNSVYLHISFSKEISDALPSGQRIGIDRGINNIAVTSENKFFGGGEVKNKVLKHKRLRQQLQRKGTKSAKRHLKRLSGQEKRFRADVNHQISKEIVKSLKAGDTLVLEDLTGIRNKKLIKAVRVLVHGWSFYQLEQFLTYKAAAAGIYIEYIDPRYTSQTCSKCGYCVKNNRKTQSSFCCQQCLFKLNADLNASRNIRNKASGSYTLPDGVNVNSPIVGAEKLLTSLRHYAGGN